MRLWRADKMWSYQQPVVCWRKLLWVRLRRACIFPEILRFNFSVVNGQTTQLNGPMVAVDGSTVVDVAYTVRIFVDHAYAFI
jgi:hypothetical protein